MAVCDYCGIDYVPTKKNQRYHDPSEGVWAYNEKRRRKPESNGQSKSSNISALIEEALQSVQDNNKPLPSYTGQKGDEHAVLLLSDIQFGVKSPDYNAATAARRLARLAEKTLHLIELHRHQSPVTTIHVALLGDLIHQDLPYFAAPDEVEKFTIDQIKELCALLKPFLLSLRESAPLVMHVIPGNHGRFSKWSANRNNFDMLLAHMLQLILPDDIQWNMARSWYLAPRILGWGFLMVHGEQFKAYSGYPWYGVGHKALRWTTSIPEPFDYLLHGHFHSAVSFHLGDITVYGNGSFFTRDEWSLQKVGWDATAAQWLLFMHEKYGVTAEYRVWLVDKKPRKR